MPDDPKFLPAVQVPQSTDIDICVKDSSWEAHIANLGELVQNAVSASIKTLGKPQTGDISVAFIGDDAIQALNAQYRGRDKPTNVLSFPGDAHNPCLGDIVIAYGVTAVEASQKQISLRDHTLHLIVHGYLHLCGYDHESDVEAQHMEALEIQTLAHLGLRNPYESNENA